MRRNYFKILPQKAPITRVYFGGRIFYSGDNKLVSTQINLGEDARTSNCRFTIADPDLSLSGEIFKESFDSGGIQVPADLLQDPPSKNAKTGATGSASAPSNSADFVTGGKNESLIIEECKRQGVTDPHHIAYILATAKHESDNFNTLEEYASGAAYEGRSDLGNTQPGDGKRFKGRGYVQLTGRANYKKYAELTGKPLLEKPELLAQDANLAAFVLVHGMKTGHFTTVGLSDFGSGEEFDAYQARRIVNGTDKAGLIEGYAEEYLSKVNSSEPETKPETKSPPAPPAPEEESEEDEDKKEEEESEEAPPKTSNKGTEIIIELGFEPNQLIRYHFIHIGSKCSATPPRKLTLRGKSIRWEMSRRLTNSSWENISLRELAESICEKYGRDLEFEGDGPTYEHLDASGITDLELLLRECRAIGYKVFDSGNTLKIAPWRPGFVGFVITPEIFLGGDFSDKADADRMDNPSPMDTPDQPDNPAADPSLEVDPATGEVVEANPENPTGTGKEKNPTTTSGASTPAVRGKVKSKNKSENSITDLMKSGTAKAANLLPDNPLPTSGGILPESITGLPQQQIGSIDLADGSATGETIRDENRRVKAYESSADVVGSQESLSLAPGSIIAIAESLFESEEAKAAFAREWRVSEVRHSLDNNGLTTSLKFYTPQAQKPPQPEGSSGAGSSESTGSGGGGTYEGQASTGDHIPPMAPGWTSCGAKCEFGTARGRWHYGLDLGGYSPDEVWASLDGEVTLVKNDNSGGSGRVVEIAHPDGSATRYLHLVNILVRQGQEVKQKQQIATRGGSGFGGDGKQIDGGGYDLHLHFEIYPGGLNAGAADPRKAIAQLNSEEG